MAKDATKVRVALTGSIYKGDEGATIPTDIETAVGAGFTELGYTTEDGIVFSVEQTTEDIPGWQSLEPLRIVVTAEPKAFNFTLRQLEKSSFTTAFGGTVTTLGANNFKWTPPAEGTQTVNAYILEFDDEAYKYRFVYRRVQMQGARELNFTRSNAVNIPLDYRVLAASPQSWEMYTNDPAFT